MRWSHHIAAKENNCFQEPFKTIEAVRISKFIWWHSQRVPDCRAGVVQRPTAVYVLSRQRGTVRQFRLADRRQRRRGAASEVGMRWTARTGSEVPCPCRHRYIIIPSLYSSLEHPANGARSRRVKLPSVHDRIFQCHLQLGGSVHHPLKHIGDSLRSETRNETWALCLRRGRDETRPWR